MKKIAILTSGGDLPGMRAAVRAVTRAAIYFGYELAGIRYGFRGLIGGDFMGIKSYDIKVCILGENFTLGEELNKTGL